MYDVTRYANPRRILVKEVQLPESADGDAIAFVRAEVSYTNRDWVGYTLEFHWVEKRDVDGVPMFFFLPQRGAWLKHEEAKRFSHKRLEALAKDPAVAARINDMLENHFNIKEA